MKLVDLILSGAPDEETSSCCLILSNIALLHGVDAKYSNSYYDSRRAVAVIEYIRSLLY